MQSEKYEQYYNEDEKSSKRAKMRKTLISIIIIILIIVVVVVLCVVFLVILKSDDQKEVSYPVYEISALLRNDSNGIEAQLKYLGTDDYYVSNKLSPFVKNLTFTASFDSDDELTLRFVDSNRTQFTLPYQYPFPFTKPASSNANRDYEIELINRPFSLKIKRKSTNETIFENRDLPFIYSDRYLEISTFLPTKYLYGLGERRQRFFYKPGTFTIWPKNQYATIDNSTGPDHQLYGHHPMYLMREKNGNFHVVFLRNSNAMDCTISDQFKVLTYKISGGIIEFKLFLGDKKPETAIKLYHNYINGYALMPFWAMGYHQSRWGYSSSKRLLEVVNNFSAYDIPLDTIWSDIDYMEKFQDFTVNENFIKSDFDTIFNKSIHWVPIIDFGIYKDNDSSSAYQKGKSLDIFIKSFLTEAPLLACVWPGIVSFPDFNHPNASKFWGDQLDNLHKKIPFSGIWLDMNEPSNFEEGEILNESYNCRVELHPVENRLLFEVQRTILPKIQMNQKENPTTDNLYIYSSNLPYIPGKLPLENKTISMNATHYCKGVYVKSTEVITEIDFHTLNGFLEGKATYDYLKGNLSKDLPFILTRSNMFGSGAFSFHWTGDNYADWEFLKTSISEIFNYQLFGIPFTGVDLCGFAGNTTEELCTRFMQAGSLYPFSRNHNSIDTKSQEPYAWGINSSVFKASRSSLKLRYSLLKWYYSVFVRNNGTGSIFKPLFFEFPEDSYLYELDDEFMIGSEILVAPVLEANRTTKEVYFTNNMGWFDFFNGSVYYEYDQEFVEVEAPLDATPPIFIKRGAIIYMQNTTNVTKVSDLSNKFKLKIALDRNLMASGYILGIDNYTDDANIVNSCTGMNDCLIKIEANGNKVDDFKINITVNFQKNSENTIIQEIYITEIEVFGFQFGNLYQTITYNFNESFLVKSGSSFSFSQSFNAYYKLTDYTFDGKKFTGTLLYQGEDEFYQQNSLSPILKNLSLTISYDSQKELTILFDDSANKRFTLPYNKPFPFTKAFNFTGNQDFYFEIPAEDRFSLRIIRNKTKEVIFDTSNFVFIYSDHYMELSTSLPSPYLFGLGERRQGFLYKDGIYTIWPKDQEKMIDNGTGPDHQLYGQHPVYLMREANGNFHIVFLRNNHAMDVQITDGVSKLTYKTIGGLLEFKIFIGDENPDSAIKAYHSYLNGYAIMPFWAMGYHQSRWGYNSSEMMLDVVKNFEKYDLPLDVIWSDVDYMNKFEDFTIDSNFKKSDFDQIRNNYSVNWVPILDLGIAKGNGSNPAHIEGESMNVYVQSSVYGKSLANCVWPGKVSYPDFNHPNSSIFWKNQLKNLYQIIPYDGLWVDMNEPSAFVEAEIDPNSECPEAPFPIPTPNALLLAEPRSSFVNLSKNSSFFTSSDLPYIPGLKPLENKTISMNATYSNKGPFITKVGPFTEFEYHGLAGYLESFITYDFLKENLSQPLPFILSRSTLFSQGAFSFHWTGDNLADWKFFQTSISEIFNFQLFGIPFVGVDLCGFAGDTTEQLCSRWMQAGAFFPFSRNHNQIYRVAQEPYAWGVNSTVYQASHKSLKMRYSIMKWYYSLFVRNNATGSVFRPLFFDFTEAECLIIEDQFLLGNELMIAPIVVENTTSRNIYFPGNDVWFDFLNGRNFYFGGQTVNITNALNATPPVFQKAGTIIYSQNTDSVRNVKDLKNEFTLNIALKNENDTFKAEGIMMAIENYTDSSDVTKYCIGNNDCLLKVWANGFLDQNDKLNLTIGFIGWSDKSNIQNNSIAILKIVGIERVEKNYVVNLSPLMKCSNGNKKNLYL